MTSSFFVQLSEAVLLDNNSLWLSSGCHTVDKNHREPVCCITAYFSISAVPNLLYDRCCIRSKFIYRILTGVQLLHFAAKIRVDDAVLKAPAHHGRRLCLGDGFADKLYDLVLRSFRLGRIQERGIVLADLDDTAFNIFSAS